MAQIIGLQAPISIRSAWARCRAYVTVRVRVIELEKAPKGAENGPNDAEVAVYSRIALSSSSCLSLPAPHPLTRRRLFLAFRRRAPHAAGRHTVTDSHNRVTDSRRVTIRVAADEQQVGV